MITPAYAPTATERVLPRMALDFTTGVLDPRVTVTRALNTATRINSSGLVEIVNANLPRFDYDPTTLAPKGLLIEEARTNLLLYSQELNNAAWLGLASGTASLPVVTANAGVAPDGTTTADRVVFNRGAGTTDGDQSRLFQNTGVLASVGTLSFWLKSFDGVSSYPVLLTNGSATTVVTVTPTWQRFTLVSSSTTTNAQVGVRGDLTPQTADILVWGAQMEAGAFATSYIPTTLLPVLRNGDSVSMTGTNFSSWYNGTAGTFGIEADSATVASVGFFLTADDGTNNNRFGFYRSGTSCAGYVVTGGATQMELTRSSIVANTVFKATVTATANDGNLAFNASLAAGDNSITMPTVTRLTIGGSGGAVAWFGHIAKISYWPQRLLNAELQAFSK